MDTKHITYKWCTKQSNENLTINWQWLLTSKKLGSVPIKDMQLRMQLRIVLKRMKKRFYVFFFFLSWKFIENWWFLEQKWRKMTITRNDHNFVFSRFRIFHVNFTLFWKKKIILMLHDGESPSTTKSNGKIYMKDLESAE